MELQGKLTNNNHWILSLRDRGLRATSQRLAVLNYLSSNPHANAESIFRGVRSLLPTISIQAIHLIVQDLTRAGVIRKISLPDSPTARYETRIDDNHHHIQCVVCGKTEDVDCVAGQAPCLDPAHSHNMRIIEASVIFNGICNECERSTETSKKFLNKKENKK